MKRLPIYLILCAALLASCSQKQKAKSTVKAFLETNMAEQSDYSVSDFGKLDSTSYVTDSTLTAMRQLAQANKTFRKDIKYGKRPAKEQLKYITAKLSVNETDTTYTFYLTNNLEAVVSFK